MSRRKWSLREDEIVSSDPTYSSDNDADVAQALGRSREDVTARRRFLKDLHSDSPEPKQEGA
jgi:hypothetical protein